MKIGGVEIGKRIKASGGVRNIAAQADRMEVLSTGITQVLEKGITDPDALEDQLHELQDLRKGNIHLAGLIDTPQGAALLQSYKDIERRMTDKLPLLVVTRPSRVRSYADEILFLRSQIVGLEKMNTVVKGPVRRAMAGLMNKFTKTNGGPDDGTI